MTCLWWECQRPVRAEGVWGYEVVRGGGGVTDGGEPERREGGGGSLCNRHVDTKFRLISDSANACLPPVYKSGRL